MKNSGPQGPWSGHAKQPSFVKREREREKSYLLFIHRPTMCGKEGIPQKAFSQKAPHILKLLYKTPLLFFKSWGGTLIPRGYKACNGRTPGGSHHHLISQPYTLSKAVCFREPTGVKRGTSEPTGHLLL